MMPIFSSDKFIFCVFIHMDKEHDCNEKRKNQFSLATINRNEEFKAFWCKT